MKQRIWQSDIKHDHPHILGGFTLHDERGTALRILEPIELESPSKAGKIEWKLITKEEIQDRCKGDYLSKGIVLVQTRLQNSGSRKPSSTHILFGHSLHPLVFPLRHIARTMGVENISPLRCRRACLFYRLQVPPRNLLQQLQ